MSARRDAPADETGEGGFEVMEQIERITEKDLRPGDILLSRGSGWISDLIVELDGGDYSHASLWSGESMIEATFDGVVECDLITPCVAYRYGNQHGALGATKLPADPVLRIARRLVGQRYAYDELFLLGLTMVLGIRPTQPVMLQILEAIGGRTGVALYERLETCVSRRRAHPAICSELVASCFWEADPTQRYAIDILDRSVRRRARLARARALPLDPEIIDYCEAVDTCEELLFGLDAPARAARKLIIGVIARQAGTGYSIASVTPADLQYSPSLRRMGEII